jgi:hypothetical protein
MAMAGPQSALSGWYNGDDARHAFESVCISPARKPKARPGFPDLSCSGNNLSFKRALLNAAVGRFNGNGDDEQTLLRSIEQTLDEGDILLREVFFPTFLFIASMQLQSWGYFLRPAT